MPVVDTNDEMREQLRVKYADATGWLPDLLDLLVADHPEWAGEGRRDWLQGRLTALGASYGATDSVFDLEKKFWSNANAATVI